MKKNLLKLSALLGFAAVSTAALAANSCCGTLECCLKMMGCC